MKMTVLCIQIELFCLNLANELFTMIPVTEQCPGPNHKEMKMLNFNYHNPTNLVFGKDQLSQLDTLIPAEARVLVTYGGGSAKKSGVLDRVKQELSGSSRTLFEFGGIEANPRLETLMKAVKIVRSEKIDFLLAVGGGSVMDGTKFISLASLEEEFIGREESLLTFGFTPVPVKKVVTIGTVVTLPATGSEANGFAVISHGKDKLPVFSPLAYPAFSILDPVLTYTLPERQVANGVVDAFVHVVEQYVTQSAEARVQDRLAEGILHTLIEIGRKTIDNPTDYDARANLVWAATTALNGHVGAGVPQDWTTHMLGHELTGHFGIDHARTLAVVLPAVWRERSEQKKAKLLQYGERIWNITNGDEETRIRLAIEKTEDFFHQLGVPTRLSSYDLTEKDLGPVIDSLKAHGMTALSETGDVTPEISMQILRRALED